MEKQTTTLSSSTQKFIISDSNDTKSDLFLHGNTLYGYNPRYPGSKAVAICVVDTDTSKIKAGDTIYCGLSKQIWIDVVTWNPESYKILCSTSKLHTPKDLICENDTILLARLYNANDGKFPNWQLLSDTRNPNGTVMFNKQVIAQSITKSFGVFYVDEKNRNILVSGKTNYDTEEKAVDSINVKFSNNSAQHDRYVVMPIYIKK